ncbi:MAG: hypothetical protein U9N53_12280 [Bacteroidota bacterium]|nr:hypothetical protein [Bacteroidota bacterium]
MHSGFVLHWFFARITIRVPVSYDQEIIIAPIPDPTDRADGGKDFQIPIKVRGTATGGTTYTPVSTEVFLYNSTETTEAGLRVELANKLYLLTTTVFYDGQEQKKGTGTISATSDIEIE